MGGSRLGLKTLSQVCRSLGTMLNSGVDIRKSFELAAGKTGSPAARRALTELSTAVRRGQDVASAMREQGSTFPPLMIDMITMGENSGALPEILIGLADHYENNVRLRRDFLGKIAWPVFQLVAAILVIALVIWVLGMIGDSQGGSPVDLLGLGTGAGAAAAWLMYTFGTAFMLWFLYQLATRALTGREIVHSIAMTIPVVGRCMQSFAIARFSWAYYLTQQTGMPIERSLMLSLRATGNGAFQRASQGICSRVAAGEDLSTALTAAGIFPDDYLHMVSVAETSGTVPETLHRLSPQFEDQARRSLSLLSASLAWGVWTLVAVFIIFIIFRIVLSYVGMINELSREALG